MRLAIPVPVVRRGLGPRRPARRRGRVAVLWGAVAFVGSTLAFGSWADGSVTFLDPAFAAKERKLAAARVAGPGPAVVAFGSSRVQQGFDAGRAESALRAAGWGGVVFNFGVAGAGPLTERRTFERLDRAGLRPTHAVVELMPAFVHDGEAGPPEGRWLNPHRLTAGERRAAGLASSWPRWTWSARRNLVLYHAAPSLLPYGVRWSYDDTSDARGTQANRNRTIPAERRAAITAEVTKEYHPVLRALRPGGLAAETFRGLIADARSRNIPLLVVLMPEGTSFREGYGPGAEDRLRAFVRTLGVPVVDARDWLSDDDFVDGHHPLRDGADRFTDRFTADALLPWLRETRP